MGASAFQPSDYFIRVFKKEDTAIIFYPEMCREDHGILKVMVSQSAFDFHEALVATLDLRRKIREDDYFKIPKGNITIFSGKFQGCIPVLIAKEFSYECMEGAPWGGLAGMRCALSAASMGEKASLP